MKDLPRFGELYKMNCATYLLNYMTTQSRSAVCVLDVNDVVMLVRENHTMISRNYRTYYVLYKNSIGFVTCAYLDEI